MKLPSHHLLSCLLALLLCSANALADDAMTKALPLRTPPPEYPANLRNENVTGLVVVKLDIDEHGKVAEATVVKSNQTKLEALALKAVRKWTFKPATKGGAVVASSMTVPIQFEIEG